MKNSFLKITLTGVLILFISVGFSQLVMKKITKLDPDLHETSGLVYYQDKYLISHNDGGNKNELFVLNLKGEIVKRITIKDTKNRDWEDLTTDTEGRLYIGDFGNNKNERKKCQIYILPANFLEQDSVLPQKIEFTYENQHHYPPTETELNYDCEAFFWKEGKLYLFTKCRTQPYTGISNIYELNAEPGEQVAKLIGSITLCKMGWRFCSVTSIDYFEETNTLAVLTYTKLYLISAFEGNEFWNGAVLSYPIQPLKQREAICFKNAHSFYLTDEHKRGLGGGNFYRLVLK